MFTKNPNAEKQTLNINGKEIDILRLDQIDPYISGNKWYKLKHNLIFAKEKKLQILTQGGAFSNHIVATAVACFHLKIPCTAIIRGDEIGTLNSNNPAIDIAQKHNMNFIFVSREDYRKNIVEISSKYDFDLKDYCFLPQGGHNDLGISGCEEIYTQYKLDKYNHISMAVGTGGTIEGIAKKTNANQKISGLSILKNVEYPNLSAYSNLTITDKYCFGGYAKYNNELLEFIQFVWEKFSLPLDFVYTAKAFYGFYHSIEKLEDKALFIHTGGLQGNLGLIHRQANLKSYFPFIL